MGNWYRVTKRINGRLYDYWQRTYRVGKSVKTENKYIGPAQSKTTTTTSLPFGLDRGHYFCRRCERQLHSLDWEGLCDDCAGGAYFARDDEPPEPDNTTKLSPKPPAPPPLTEPFKPQVLSQEERREDESIQYGSLYKRKKKHATQLRAAKHKTKGIKKKLNPFLAQALLKDKKGL